MGHPDKVKQIKKFGKKKIIYQLFFVLVRAVTDFSDIPQQIRQP